MVYVNRAARLPCSLCISVPTPRFGEATTAAAFTQPLFIRKCGHRVGEVFPGESSLSRPGKDSRELELARSFPGNSVSGMLRSRLYASARVVRAYDTRGALNVCSREIGESR
jgi:hypothetical protein